MTVDDFCRRHVHRAVAIVGGGSNGMERAILLCREGYDTLNPSYHENDEQVFRHLCRIWQYANAPELSVCLASTACKKVFDVCEIPFGYVWVSDDVCLERFTVPLQKLSLYARTIGCMTVVGMENELIAPVVEKCLKAVQPRMSERLPLKHADAMLKRFRHAIVKACATSRHAAWIEQIIMYEPDIVLEVRAVEKLRALLKRDPAIRFQRPRRNKKDTYAWLRDGWDEACEQIEADLTAEHLMVAPAKCVANG